MQNHLLQYREIQDFIEKHGIGGTGDVKEEFDEIDKKVDEAWGTKLNTIKQN